MKLYIYENIGWYYDFFLIIPQEMKTTQGLKAFLTIDYISQMFKIIFVLLLFLHMF